MWAVNVSSVNVDEHWATEFQNKGRSVSTITEKNFVEKCHLTWPLNYKQNSGTKNIGEAYSKDPVLGNLHLLALDKNSEK